MFPSEYKFSWRERAIIFLAFAIPLGLLFVGSFILNYNVYVGLIYYFVITISPIIYAATRYPEREDFSLLSCGFAYFCILWINNDIFLNKILGGSVFIGGVLIGMVASAYLCKSYDSIWRYIPPTTIVGYFGILTMLVIFGIV